MRWRKTQPRWMWLVVIDIFVRNQGVFGNKLSATCFYYVTVQYCDVGTTTTGKGREKMGVAPLFFLFSFWLSNLVNERKGSHYGSPAARAPDQLTGGARRLGWVLYCMYSTVQYSTTPYSILFLLIADCVLRIGGLCFKWSQMHAIFTI